MEVCRGGREAMHGNEQRMRSAIDRMIVSLICNWNASVGRQELTYQEEKEIWAFGKQKRPDFTIMY